MIRRKKTIGDKIAAAPSALHLAVETVEKMNEMHKGGPYKKEIENLESIHAEMQTFALSVPRQT